MKKNLLAFLVLTGLAGLLYSQNAAPSAPAKEKVLTITGTVVSIDTATKTIVIKDREDQTDKTFSGKKKEIASLGVGDLVKAKVNPGKNKALSIRKVPPVPKAMNRPAPPPPGQ